MWHVSLSFLRRNVILLVRNIYFFSFLGILFLISQMHRVFSFTVPHITDSPFHNLRSHPCRLLFLLPQLLRVCLWPVYEETHSKPKILNFSGRIRPFKFLLSTNDLYFLPLSLLFVTVEFLLKSLWLGDFLITVRCKLWIN